MSTSAMANHVNDPDDDLADYEDEEVPFDDHAKDADDPAGTANQKEVKKGSYVAVHTSGFRDFLLKPEILRAIQDCGFEHPSEVQQECIPQVTLGVDVICQAKSGMGKTAVFVISTLQQIEPKEGECDTIVLAHTRELAYQICKEFQRFGKYFPGLRIEVIYGGVPIKEQKKRLKESVPHIIVGTPGRTLHLIKEGALKVDKIKRFILDECDSLLEPLEMRRDVQQIFKYTPKEKQVMLFSATIVNEVRDVARKFAQKPLEIFIDDESKLTLHGLIQHFVKVSETEKNRKLTNLLDSLEFNQVIIFVKSVRRASELSALLQKCAFPSMCIHSDLPQAERIERYNKFKQFKARILVSTDVFGRGVDIERVNIVVNYDMPKSAEDYLHRVGRAGRFGTKGLAISFVSSDEDQTVLESVQSRFEVKITTLPDTIDASTYTQG